MAEPTAIPYSSADHFPVNSLTIDCCSGERIIGRRHVTAKGTSGKRRLAAIRFSPNHGRSAILDGNNAIAAEHPSHAARTSADQPSEDVPGRADGRRTNWRAGRVSRAGVSAIETNRLAPSTSAALALAAALECRVEDLFQLAGAAADRASWAWQPPRDDCRYWRASTAKGELLYPVEATDLGALGHDGVYREGGCRERGACPPSGTLVIATCDPAVGLLAGEYAHRSGFRLLAFPPSSRKALELLSQGLVHAAGIHLTTVGRQEKNAAAARSNCRAASASSAGQAGRPAWPLRPVCAC